MLSNNNHDNSNAFSFTRFNQNMYLYLLQRYLLQKFGSAKNLSEILANVMTVLTELDNLIKIEYELMKRYMKSLTPLIREILDL